MTTTIGSDEHVERSVVAPPPLLLMAMELGKYEWKVGFTTGLGQRPRRRTIRTDHWQRLADEITTAKHRLGLAPDAPVTSCYEAGPDGFWVHRYLTTLGATNLVVDSSSIEVSRRARRAKTDRVDVERLLALLLRYTTGERTALRVVRVPGEDDEQRRQLHRELRTLLTERRRVINRVTGLLLTQSIRVKITGHFPERLPALRQWDGQPLSPAFRTRRRARSAVYRPECRHGPPAARAPWTRRSQCLAVCHGDVRLATVHESTADWRGDWTRADPVPERDPRSGAGHQQSGQPHGPDDRRADRVDLGPVPARQRVDAVVPHAIRQRRPARPEDRDRGAGPPTLDRPLALSRRRDRAGRRGLPDRTRPCGTEPGRVSTGVA